MSLIISYGINEYAYNNFLLYGNNEYKYNKSRISLKQFKIRTTTRRSVIRLNKALKRISERRLLESISENKLSNASTERSSSRRRKKGGTIDEQKDYIDNILKNLYINDAYHDFKIELKKDHDITELSGSEGEIFNKVLTRINILDTDLLSNLHFISSITPDYINKYFGSGVAEKYDNFKDYLDNNLNLFSKEKINDGSITHIKNNELKRWLKTYLNEPEHKNFISSEVIYDPMGTSRDEINIFLDKMHDEPDKLNIHAEISNEVYNNINADKSTGFNELTKELFNIVYYKQPLNKISIALLFKKDIKGNIITTGGAKTKRKLSRISESFHIRLLKKNNDDIYILSPNDDNGYYAIDIIDYEIPFSINKIKEMLEIANNGYIINDAKNTDSILNRIILYIRDNTLDLNTTKNILLDLKKAGDYGKVLLGYYYNNNIKNSNKLLLLTNDIICALNGILRLNTDVICGCEPPVATSTDTRVICIYTPKDDVITDYYKYFIKKITQMFQIDYLDVKKYDTDLEFTDDNYKIFYSILEVIILDKINKKKPITNKDDHEELLIYIVRTIKEAWDLVNDMKTNSNDNKIRINKNLSNCNELFTNYLIFNLSEKKNETHSKLLNLIKYTAINQRQSELILGINEGRQTFTKDIISKINYNKIKDAKMIGINHKIIAFNILKNILNLNYANINDILNVVYVYENFSNYIIKFKRDNIITFENYATIQIFINNFDKLNNNFEIITMLLISLEEKKSDYDKLLIKILEDELKKNVGSDILPNIKSDVDRIYNEFNNIIESIKKSNEKYKTINTLLRSIIPSS